MAADFEHPQPAADWETRAYWEGCGRHQLVLQRCQSCGTVQHRPRAMCVSCFADDIVHFVASGRGTVHTFSIIEQNQAPPFRDACPYVLAYVELEEGPRVMTNIVGCEASEVSIGQSVVVDYQDRDEGFAVPRFRPA
jgi:uncharacterized OB-fold protein